MIISLMLRVICDYLIKILKKKLSILLLNDLDISILDKNTIIKKSRI